MIWSTIRIHTWISYKISKAYASTETYLIGMKLLFKFEVKLQVKRREDYFWFRTMRQWQKKYCTGCWMPTFFRQPFRSNICYRTIINIHPGIFILISYDGPKVVFEMEDVMGPITSSSRLTRQEWSMKVIYHFGEATYLQSVFLVERQVCFFSVFIRTILTHKPRTNQN
jgi:hypothetical protein